MGARLRVFLTTEQDRTLFEIRTATTVPQRVKDRAAVLRLSAQGWYVEKIATHMNWNEDTVRETIHRWHKQGLGGLWDAPKPGGKRRWQESDIEHIEQALRDEPRTYNSKQLARKLKEDRKVDLSADRLRRILKKRGCDGSVPARVIMLNKTLSNERQSRLT
jgi:transposase